MPSTGEIQHPARFPEDELIQGMRVVSRTLKRAVAWADALAGEEGIRLRLAADQLSDGTAQQCFALLTAERALIEFVVGPATKPGKAGVLVKAKETDICPRCFVSGWTLRRYRREHLRSRRSRINKHLSHLTWSQIIPRQWHTTPITLVVEAFAEFYSALDLELPRVSPVLAGALAEVAPVVERLRQIGTPEVFEFKALSVPLTSSNESPG